MRLQQPAQNHLFRVSFCCKHAKMAHPIVVSIEPFGFVAFTQIDSSFAQEQEVSETQPANNAKQRPSICFGAEPMHLNCKSFAQTNTLPGLASDAGPPIS